MVFKSMEIRENIRDLEKRDRPRERLIANGPEYLSDVELLAVLIGSGIKGRGVQQVAAEVLSALKEGSGRTVVDLLKKVKGIGEAKGAQIAAALEYSRRKLFAASRKISSPGDVIPLINHYADKKQEHFLSLSLNGANEVIEIRVVSIGLVNRTLVHPREIFADILMDRASGVVVAHNHPSGNIEPSREDMEITIRVKNAAELLGINLLDHIIFASGGYYSFLEKGKL